MIDATLRSALREVFNGAGTPAQREEVRAWLAESATGTAEAMLAQRRPMRRLSRSQALTARERQIVRLLCVGYSTAEIAPELFMAPSTVKTHISHALHRTHSRHRAHLVARFTRGEVR